MDDPNCIPEQEPFRRSRVCVYQRHTDGEHLARKQHVIYTEVMLPTNAPQEYTDRSLLWNSVEWNETNSNAQLARSIEFALPAELTHEQNIALVRKLVQKLFVNKGMCADISGVIR